MVQSAKLSKEFSFLMRKIEPISHGTVAPALSVFVNKIMGACGARPPPPLPNDGFFY